VSCEGKPGTADHIWAIEVGADGDLVITAPPWMHVWYSWHVFALFTKPTNVGGCFASGQQLRCYDHSYYSYYGYYPYGIFDFYGLTAGTYYFAVSDFNTEGSMELDFSVALYPSGSEICNNGDDDDWNGDKDCDDADCTASAYCQDEICDNGTDDDDTDSYVDCNDHDCVGTTECTGGVYDSDLDLGVIVRPDALAELSLERVPAKSRLIGPSRVVLVCAFPTLRPPNFFIQIFSSKFVHPNLFILSF
jgi:hypothetical protein